MKKHVLIFAILVFCSISISAQVKKSVVCTPGKLSTLLTETEKSTITDLTITGTIDVRDFSTMRAIRTLKVLDLSKVTVSAYAGKLANAIPDSAFFSCTSLTSINIPSSVTSIGDWAFEFCSDLISINIPASVTSIGIKVFLYCSGQIIVSENNRIYSSLEGVLFNKTKTELIQCPASKPGYYAIPSSVTSIGDDAFSGCWGLTSISIPSSVTSIGNSAFNYCPGLTSINIAPSVTSIGDHAFEACISLTSINIPSSVVSVGDYAFQDCKVLTSINIPSSVTSIGDFTFRYCSSLSSINIPSSVTSIGNGTFEWCDNLTSINIPSSVTSIEENAFTYCYGLTSINIPSSVTSIGIQAFCYCYNLSLINIPSSVTSIGEGAFFSCHRLTSINIPSSVTSIGTNTFGDCRGLTSISIPSSVTSIGEGAFWGCSKLTSISIPSSVITIGGGAFRCSSLKSVYSMTINPVNLSSAHSVFEGVNRNTCILYVPKGSKNAYSTAVWWQDFVNIVEMDGLMVSQNTASVSAKEDTAYIDVIYSDSWSVKSSATWLTINPAKGSGITTLGLSALANTTNEARRATVTVSAEGQPDQIITVTQGDITTGIYDNVNTNLKIYPNPANDFIYISGDNLNRNCHYEILDLSGKQIQKGQLSENRITTSNLLSGIYFVKIYDDNTVSTQKFIKQ